MPKALAENKLHACTECQKRKSKCSGSAPCSYCARSNKRCVFNAPRHRTPLTRKNLDGAERRCHALTTLLQKLAPDLDVESSLKEESKHVTWEEDQNQNNSPAANSPAPSDGFEWSEAPLASPAGESDPIRRGGPDGMASLPSRQSSTGYLGTSSGTSLIEAISDLLPGRPTLAAGESRARLRPNSRQQRGYLDNMVLPRNLADSNVIESLINAYFCWYNPSYPILHEPTFRAKHQIRHQIQESSSWHPIFYIVLAIGSWILGSETDPEAYDFYAAARSHMSLRMLEAGNLHTVQAFLLMGNYLQKRDRPNTGYNFIGIAYRMALGLGLHRELPSSNNNDILFHERRRVVWWVVYCFDSGFSLTTGRPVMTSDSFNETRLPRNIDDSTCSQDSILPTPIDHPTNYSAIIAQSRLAYISNTIFTNLFAASNHTPFNIQSSRSIEHKLRAWKLSLPSYFSIRTVPEWFQGPRAIVIWKEQNIRMMLWWGTQRLLYESTPDQIEARNTCQYTAMETIQDIAAFCHEKADALHPGMRWYATYFIFQAALVLNIHTLQPSQSQPEGATIPAVDEELWGLSVSRAHDCLAFLGRTNKPQAATRCLEVLERITAHSRLQLQQPQPTTTIPEPIQSTSTSTSTSMLGPSQYPASANDLDLEMGMGIRPAGFAADPSLQIFFENTSLEADPFEGIDGFPSTQEPDLFDYLPFITYGVGDGQGGSEPSNTVL